MGEEGVKEYMKLYNYTISMWRAHPSSKILCMMILQLMGLYSRCHRNKKKIKYIVSRHLLLSRQVILSGNQNSGYKFLWRIPESYKYGYKWHSCVSHFCCVMPLCSLWWTMLAEAGLDLVHQVVSLSFNFSLFSSTNSMYEPIKSPMSRFAFGELGFWVFRRYSRFLFVF